MIINFGSINIDHVYGVASLPTAGETITATSVEKFLGGKGINQSIAAQASGCKTRHVGALGDDGAWALSQIEAFGVDTDHITAIDGPTGHAIITVDDHAENQIIIAGGANQKLTHDMIVSALGDATPNRDWVLLQNETNLASEIVGQAKENGLKVAYAAAPFIADITISLLPQVDLLAVNEGEANELAKALDVDVENLPVPELLITRGASGAELIRDEERFTQKAFNVEAVDTTGAGDTFLGSFLGRYATEDNVEEALRYAAAASAIQVTRRGAAPAIPIRDEVLNFLKGNT